MKKLFYEHVKRYEKKKYMKEYGRKRYAENRDKILEDQKVYASNPEIKAKRKERIMKMKDAYAITIKKYYFDHRDKILEDHKKWLEKEKEHVQRYTKQYNIKNEKIMKQKSKVYRIKNQKILHEKNKVWRDKNKIKRCISFRLWRENNPNYWINYNKAFPEVGLRANHKQLKKLGLKFHKTSKEYARALQSWSKVVKKNITNTCAYCNNEGLIQVHHILYKNKYPLLSLNPNNGIPLCKKCHYEVHLLNGFK